jgi:hypothetical protein
MMTTASIPTPASVLYAFLAALCEVIAALMFGLIWVR